MSITTHRITIVGVALGLLIATSWPYVQQSRHAPAGKSSTGILHLTPGDIPVYYSFIEQGREGRLIQENLFTTAPQLPAVFSPHWWLIGQMANALHLSTVTAYQVSRIFLGVVVMWLVYLYIGALIPAGPWRSLVWVAALTATGFGVFLPIHIPIQGLSLPADRWIPESSLFLSLYHNPLFLMGVACIVGTFMLFARSEKRPKLALAAAGLATALAIVHPYDVFIVAAVIGVEGVLRILLDRTWSPQRAVNWFRRATVTLVPAGLVLLINRFIFSSQPALKGWAAANVTTSPQWWWYLPAFGLPLLFAALGAKRFLRENQSPLRFLTLAWAGVVPVLLYLPHFPYQRRMEEGWMLPLIVLGSYGLLVAWAGVQKAIKQFWARALLAALGILSITLGVWSSGLGRVIADEQLAVSGQEPAVVPAGLISAGDWLKHNTPQDASVLARPHESQFIPGWSGRRVYFGHDDLSGTDSGEKRQKVEEFFSLGPGLDVSKFIQQNHLGYLLVRTDDQRGLATVGSRRFSSTLVFSNRDVNIYQLSK